MGQVDQVTEVELEVEVEVMNMINKLAIEGGEEGENRGCRQGGPTKLPAMGGGQQQRPGKEEPLVGWRKEGAINHQQCWSQFLVGFIHPVRWHPPDDGRLCLAAAARRCPCPSPHPWRRGLVSRWSSRTREAQWEEEQTANLSGAQ